MEISLFELAGDARRPGAEPECLVSLLECVRPTICEKQQQSRVTLHRSADVGDDYQWPRFDFRLALRPIEDLSAVSEIPANGATQIQQPPMSATESSGASFPYAPHDLRHQRFHRVELSGAEVAEVLVAQHLSLAVGQSGLKDGRFVRTAGRRIDDGCGLLPQWRRNDLRPAIPPPFPNPPHAHRHHPPPPPP